MLYAIEEASNRHVLGMDSDERGAGRHPVIKKEKVSEHVTRFCSSWTGKNGRAYEHCLLAAK